MIIHGRTKKYSKFISSCTIRPWQMQSIWFLNSIIIF